MNVYISLSQMNKLQDISVRDMCISSAGGSHSQIGELLPSKWSCVCVWVWVCGRAVLMT